MKKFFLAIAVMLTAFMATSCKDTVSGIVYNVNVEGNASGDVVVTFPNGSLELNGQAGLLFAYSNDTAVNVRKAEDGIVLGAAVESEDEDVREFANTVETGFSVALKDAQAGGTYHVRVYGYAKEPTTGITILIDKTFDYPAPVDAE